MGDVEYKPHELRVEHEHITYDEYDEEENMYVVCSCGWRKDLSSTKPTVHEINDLARGHVVEARY